MQDHNQSEQRSEHYALIPAVVRYDKDLPPRAALLYGEIYALSAREGVCWATNAYFTRLYGVGERTLQYWIDALCAKGYILRNIEYANDGKTVMRRCLTVQKLDDCTTSRKNLREGGAENCGRGGAKNCGENITSKNKTSDKNNDDDDDVKLSPAREGSPDFDANAWISAHLRQVCHPKLLEITVRYSLHDDAIVREVTQWLAALYERPDPVYTPRRTFLPEEIRRLVDSVKTDLFLRLCEGFFRKLPDERGFVRRHVVNPERYILTALAAEYDAK